MEFKADNGKVTVDRFDGRFELADSVLENSAHIERTGDYVKIVVSNGVADYAIVGRDEEKKAWRLQKVWGRLR